MNPAAKQFLDALLYRHACKEFDPDKKISQGDFAFILEAGRMSPSSFGFEPWKFLVIQNKEIREKLRAFTWGAQGQLPTASHYVAILARRPEYMQPKSPYVQETMMRRVQQLSEDMCAMRTERYGNFRQNDFCLNDNEEIGFEWACRQCYIALANMMTAAAFIKVDSCAIEGFPRKTMEDFMAREQLAEPERYGMALMVAFGYRAKDPRPKTRRPIGEVVRWVE